MLWNMAESAEVLIILLAALSSIANCNVQYINHKISNGNAIEEGTSVTISCHFDGNKPPGSTRWMLNREVVAIDCKVQPPGIGIITPTSDCFPDTGNGTANLSFVIHRVSLDRDKDKWMCQHINLKEKLNFPIRVEGLTAGYTTNCNDDKKSHFSVTAHIGCTYPPAKVHWCLNNGSKTDCSDQTDWVASVFETAPAISQTTEECTNYNTPGVFKYKSTIEGKLADGVNVDQYKMYYSVNGINYTKNAISLQEIRRAEYIMEISGICMEKLCKAAMVLYWLDIVYLVILTVLTLLNRAVSQRFLKVGVKKYLDTAFYAVVLLGYVLIFSSLILFISTNLLFEEWIVDSFSFGVIGVLTISYSIVLYWFIKRRSGPNGYTLLGDAIVNGQSDRVKSLLLPGYCDVDKTDNTGCTPLHLAAQNGRLEIVRILINAGANADLRNKDGKTPLQLAKKGRFTDIADYLHQYIKKLSEQLQSLKHVDLNNVKINETMYHITQNNKRGRAVIITYDKTNKSNTGVQHDQDSLFYLFRSLNFKSVVYKYKTKNEMIHALNAESSHPDHAEADAFILCVLTYGNKDVIVSSDGENINVEDEIWSVFNGRNCPKLDKKPKIFIMQACQREKVLEDEDCDDEATMIPLVDKSISISTINLNMPESKKKEQKHRLIAYATVQDYNSKSTPSNGSLFIHQIVDAFTKHAHEEHVQDLFTTVRNNVTVKNDKTVQIPPIDSTLAKKFFLFPGY